MAARAPLPAPPPLRSRAAARASSARASSLAAQHQRLQADAEARAAAALLAAAAAERDDASDAAAADALAAAAERRIADNAERDFLAMLRHGLPPAATALRLALLLLLAALGVTRVRCTGFGSGIKSPKPAKQLSETVSRRASSGGVPPAPGAPPLGSDGELPPQLLLLSLHGDKDKAGDEGNALRRFRVTGARSNYGRARLRLDELAPVALAEEAGARRTLLYPRAMALLPGNRIAVASAAGGDGGEVRAASASAVCAAGGGLGAPPPPPAPVMGTSGNNASKAVRVASAPLCGAGLDHPYGIAVAMTSPPVLLVSNQGSGVVTSCALDGPQAGPQAPPAFFARHGSTGSSGATADDGDSGLDSQDAGAPAPAAVPQLRRNLSGGGGGADSPLRGIAVDRPRR